MHRRVALRRNGTQHENANAALGLSAQSNASVHASEGFTFLRCVAFEVLGYQERLFSE